VVTHPLVLGIALGTVPGTVQEVVLRAFCRAILKVMCGANSCVVSTATRNPTRARTAMAVRNAVWRATCGGIFVVIPKGTCAVIRRGTCPVVPSAVRVTTCGVKSGRPVRDAAE
jgi:hypothetical protein